MRSATALLAVLFTCAAVLTAAASDLPRSARITKDAGNQFLQSKKYADAVDCYLQAIELCPAFPEAHYNLGVALLKGYSATNLALYHFSRYLELDPEAADRADVEALLEALRNRVSQAPAEPGRIIGVVAGRLLVSGTEWVGLGETIELSEGGEAPATGLLVEFVYPDAVLTQRIRDADTLQRLRGEAVAMGSLLPSFGR